MANIILEENIELINEIIGNKIADIKVERAVLGLFFTGVKLNNGFGGLCFTPIKEIPEAVCCPSSAKAMPISGKLSNRPVLDYLKDLSSENSLRKALAIAALNALSQYCLELGAYKEFEITENCDAFDKIDVKKFRKAVVVGVLVPMIKKLIAGNADFKILEKDPSTLKAHEMNYFIPADRYEEIVPSADLLVITGVTVLNDTLPYILKIAKKGAEILVTGPTASMLPQPFFKRNVTMIGGIAVTKPDELLDIIAEGGSGYHFFGKYANRIMIKAK